MMSIVLGRAFSQMCECLAVRAAVLRRPTARWQDKGARGALRYGRAFSMACAANARGAPVRRSLRLGQLANDIRMMARCARSRQ